MSTAKEQLEALDKAEIIDLYLALEVAFGNAQNAVRHADKMALLGEMSGNMAHEINNPLLVLTGYISKLTTYLSEAPVDPVKAAKALERIDSMTKRIQYIVKGLLKFSRNEQQLDFAAEKLQTIFDDTIILCKHKLKRACVDLTVDPFPEDLEIVCAQIQVSQVLLNLLSNAHDAIKDQENPWIRIGVSPSPTTLTITVTDSGYGIPEAIQKNIFERGFTTKGVGVGTGLGLALCAEFIEAHGGRLYVDNNKPNTTFVIEIPKNPASKAS